MSLIPTPRLIKQRARFVVRVQAAPGVALVGRFMDCSELSAEVAVSRMNHSGSMIPEKAPSRVTFADVTLQRGATQNADLFRWFAQAVVPTPTFGGVGLGHERVVDIVEQDRDRSTLNRWRLVRAWPTKYTAATEWNNDSDDFTLEAITLTYAFFVPIGLPAAVRIDHIAAALS